MDEHRIAAGLYMDALDGGTDFSKAERLTRNALVLFGLNEPRASEVARNARMAGPHGPVVGSGVDDGTDDSGDREPSEAEMDSDAFRDAVRATEGGRGIGRFVVIAYSGDDTTLVVGTDEGGATWDEAQDRAKEMLRTWTGLGRVDIAFVVEGVVPGSNEGSA